MKVNIINECELTDSDIEYLKNVISDQLINDNMFHNSYHTRYYRLNDKSTKIAKVYIPYQKGNEELNVTALKKVGA